MKIEAYLFIPYGGQYRFSFEAFQEGPHLRVTEAKESNRAFDFYWDISMRSRPTLHELVSDERRAEQIQKTWERACMNAFKDSSERIIHTPNKTIRKTLAEAYVEFVHVVQ